MGNIASTDFELDDGFVDDEPTPESGEQKNNAPKTCLAKRRLIDDLLEEKRLQRHLKAYDFDFDDDL